MPKLIYLPAITIKGANIPIITMAIVATTAIVRSFFLKFEFILEISGYKYCFAESIQHILVICNLKGNLIAAGRRISMSWLPGL